MSRRQGSPKCSKAPRPPPDPAPQPDATGRLHDDCRQGDATHTHLRKPEPTPHQHRVQRTIRHKTRDQKIPIHLRVALCIQRCIDRHLEDEEDASAEDHIHVGQCHPQVFALCSQQLKQRWRGEPPNDGKPHPSYTGKCQGLREKSSCAVLVLGSDRIRHQRRRALAQSTACGN